MKNKKVSVIIVAYNEERDIVECIESLIRQDYAPMEIIVVDDGSTDSTKHVLKEQPVRILSLTHQGTAIARNFGASKAKGEILSFLDADMTFDQSFIKNLVKPINASKAKGTFSKLEYVSNWEEPMARCWNRMNRPRLPDRFRIPQHTIDGEDFRAILKTEFLKVNGFDNTGYTDTWTLGRKLGYRPINAPNAIYYHMNPQNIIEMFQASKWIGKRDYRYGKVGNIVAIFRSLIFVSVLKGIFEMIRYGEPAFLICQITYDFGILSGSLSNLLFGEVKK